MSCVEVFDGVVGCRREDRGGPRNPMAKTEKDSETQGRPKEVWQVLQRRFAARSGRGDRVRVRIARRAFEVFCARGGQPGRALDDWLQAERELTAGQAFDAR